MPTLGITDGTPLHFILLVRIQICQRSLILIRVGLMVGHSEREMPPARARLIGAAIVISKRLGGGGGWNNLFAKGTRIENLLTNLHVSHLRVFLPAALEYIF
jgi:hypothetical protein